MPKVTILTPAFNSAKYIGETIESALKQTFQDFEMMIIDDGSTDNTRDIVAQFTLRYPDKIRYLYQSNQGPGSARNYGIKHSTGEYIALLDSDDIWFPHRLEEGVKVLDAQKDVGLVHARAKQLFEDGSTSTWQRQDIKYLSGNMQKYLLARKAHISCMTVLFRRSCLKEIGLFDEVKNCIGVEDRDLWIRLASKFKIHFIDQELGLYRMLSTSLSRNEDVIIERKKYIIEKNGKALKHFFIRHRAIASIYKEFGDHHLELGHFKKAKARFAEAIKYWPFYLWAWMNYVKCVARNSDKVSSVKT
jgi:glycosyltransferase involved in cell wall biosynthesis